MVLFKVKNSFNIMSQFNCLKLSYMVKLGILIHFCIRIQNAVFSMLLVVILCISQVIYPCLLLILVYSQSCLF